MPKLMLVEDDNNLREIYEARLQAEGYQIVTAKDGEEALVVAKAEKPDLIISDIMMPKISGFEMLDILRNTEGLKEVKVIMLTALGQNDDQQKADRLGADRYLVKSQVTLEDIVKVTHELLGDQAAAPGAAAPAAPVAVSPAPTPTPAPVNPPSVAPVATPPAPVTPAAPAAVTPPVPTPAPAPAPATPPASGPSLSDLAAPSELASPPAAPAVPPAPVTPAAVADVIASTVPSLENSTAPASGSAISDEPAAPATTTVTTASTEAASNKATNDAQSTDQEEAAVESQVEDFVAGASQEPTLPSATTSEATSAPTTAPQIEAVPDTAAESLPDTSTTPGTQVKPTIVKPTDPATAAKDDKLVADAAETLSDSTEGDASISDTDTTKTQSDGRTKKIIPPIDKGSRKDINDLLALEEAKEASTSSVEAVPVVVADDPKGKPTSAPQNPIIAPPPDAGGEEPAIVPAKQTPLPSAEAQVDPNSIAL